MTDYPKYQESLRLEFSKQRSERVRGISGHAWVDDAMAEQITKALNGPPMILNHPRCTGLSTQGAAKSVAAAVLKPKIIIGEESTYGVEPEFKPNFYRNTSRLGSDRAPSVMYAKTYTGPDRSIREVFPSFKSMRHVGKPIQGNLSVGADVSFDHPDSGYGMLIKHARQTGFTAMMAERIKEELRKNPGQFLTKHAKGTVLTRPSQELAIPKYEKVVIGGDHLDTAGYEDAAWAMSYGFLLKQGQKQIMDNLSKAVGLGLWLPPKSGHKLTFEISDSGYSRANIVMEAKPFPVPESQ